MLKELEVKVLDIDIDFMKNKILELGGKLIGREKQINTLIDSNNRPIKSYMDAYLRIRETHDLIKDEHTVTFTLKKNQENKILRESEEYNVLVENKDTLLEIMKNLGFNNVSVGFKARDSYCFLGGRIDFDVWDDDTYPYPYMEIEVSNEKNLNKILTKLEINKEKVSKLSIVELQEKLKDNQ